MLCVLLSSHNKMCLQVMLGRGSPTAACPLAKLGRSSPDYYCGSSLDQGYHTLVPSGWPPSTGHQTEKAIKRSRSSGLCHAERLPDDLLLRVFACLDSADLVSCARVCRRWETLAWEPSLWTNLTLLGENLSGDRAIR